MSVDQPEVIQRDLQQASCAGGPDLVARVQRSALGQPAVQGKRLSLGSRLRRVPDRELDLTQIVRIRCRPLPAVGVRQVILGVPDSVGAGRRRQVEDREQEPGSG